jgi:hypothetical protein
MTDISASHLAKALEAREMLFEIPDDMALCNAIGGRVKLTRGRVKNPEAESRALLDAIGETSPASARGWNDPWPDVSEATLTAALRGCWMTVYGDNGATEGTGYPAHPDRLATACLRWIASDRADAPELPGKPTAPPEKLPAMDIERLAEIVESAFSGQTVVLRPTHDLKAGREPVTGFVSNPGRAVRTGIRAAALELSIEKRTAGWLDQIDRAMAARILASLADRYAAPQAKTDDPDAPPPTEAETNPQGAQTAMRLHAGEDWTVRPDMRPGREEDDDNPDLKFFTKFERDAHTGQQVTAVSLRRVGWLDQKGRVWTQTPPTAGFDGGSLTPLLIDARD